MVSYGNNRLSQGSRVGTGIQAASGISNLSITQQTDKVNGEYVFDLEYSSNNTKVEANGIPMINISANRFHGENNDEETEATLAIMSEGVASKQTGTAKSYYYYDVAEKTYYKYGKLA